MKLADSKQSPIGETPSVLSPKPASAGGDTSGLSTGGGNVPTDEIGEFASDVGNHLVMIAMIVFAVLIIIWIFYHIMTRPFEVNCENGCRLANGTIQYYTGINASCMRLFP